MNAIHWTLHYNPTVIRYLISLGESGSLLRRFIAYLQIDPLLNGWAIHHPDNEKYEICVEGHVVLYELQEEDKKIRILLVEPY